MKASQIPLFTNKEAPRDAQIKSHQLLLRAGYIHKQTSGFYSYLPFGLITHRKIEQIIREQMNFFGAAEIRLPVVTSSEMWKQSGRWSQMGSEMMRLKDRHENHYCLAPTHEEAVTHLAKAYLKSYKQLPVNLYQIGTKYRDEIRPRYGLIRCREFVMKDAYSFHVTDESLDETYEKMRKCYRSIFDRCGLKTIPVQADSSSMGGAYSEEFMAASEVGESTLLLSEDMSKCSYQANQEKTKFVPATPYPRVQSTERPKLFDTPKVTSVEDVAKLLKQNIIQFIKTIVHEDEDHIVISFIPGDRELSLVKLKNISSRPNLQMASHETIEKFLKVPPGFIGPYQLPVSHGEKVCITSQTNLDKNSFSKKILIYYDLHLKRRGELVGGGNQKDTHYINLQEGRDFIIHRESHEVDLVEARAGDLCPEDTSQKLIEKKGIELGHIFKIGKKYSEMMKLGILDSQGKSIHPTMGCYGIGVDRTLQAFVEQSWDAHGIIWSQSLTPYDIYYIPIFGAEEELKKHEEVYKKLEKIGFDVYFDDRKERPGVKFYDADLVGFPWQIIGGKKFLESEVLELKNRKSMLKENMSFEQIIKRIEKNHVI